MILLLISPTPSYINTYNEYADLVIVHQFCTDREAQSNIAHVKKFLAEVIPMIGRLDGKAEYVECEGWSPRLNIFL